MSRGSELWNKLCNDGPQPADQLNNVPVTLREDGVQRFKVRSGRGSTQPIGKTPVIYYIEDKHNPETVLSVWADERGDIPESVSAKAIHFRISRYGEEWKKASTKLFGPVNQERGGENTSGGVCPLCGEGYPNSLANHLSGCPEGEPNE